MVTDCITHRELSSTKIQCIYYVTVVETLNLKATLLSLYRGVYILNLIQSPDITSHARVIERSKAEKWYNRRQRASWYTWKYIGELNRVKWKRALRHATYKIRRQVKDLRKSRVSWLLSRLIYKYHVWLSNESHYLPSFRFLSFLFSPFFPPFGKT